MNKETTKCPWRMIFHPNEVHLLDEIMMIHSIKMGRIDNDDVMMTAAVAAAAVKVEAVVMNLKQNLNHYSCAISVFELQSKTFEPIFPNARVTFVTSIFPEITKRVILVDLPLLSMLTRPRRRKLSEIWTRVCWEIVKLV